MVKKNKIICVDDDLHVKLGETNASSLINGLLREYFDGEGGDKVEFFKKKIALFRAEKVEILQKIRDFKQKIEVIQEAKEKIEQEKLDIVKKEARKKEVEIMTEKWRNDEITDEQFYAFCDND